MLEVLRLPHLVLADVGDDDGLVASGGLRFAPDVVDDVRGVEVAVVGKVDDVADGGVAFRVDLARARWVGSFREQRQEVFEDFFEVADQGYVGADVLVDLGGVDLDVDLFCVLRVVGEVAGDAVVEAHAEGEEEVRFLDGVVDPRLAVHAHHAEGERMGGGKAAKAEQCGGEGNGRRNADRCQSCNEKSFLLCHAQFPVRAQPFHQTRAQSLDGLNIRLTAEFVYAPQLLLIRCKYPLLLDGQGRATIQMLLGLIAALR